MHQIPNYFLIFLKFQFYQGVTYKFNQNQSSLLITIYGVFMSHRVSQVLFVESLQIRVALLIFPSKYWFAYIYTLKTPIQKQTQASTSASFGLKPRSITPKPFSSYQFTATSQPAWLVRETPSNTCDSSPVTHKFLLSALPIFIFLWLICFSKTILKYWCGFCLKYATQNPFYSFHILTLNKITYFHTIYELQIINIVSCQDPSQNLQTHTSLVKCPRSTSNSTNPKIN